MVGGTLFESKTKSMRWWFQCSQSSRGWWNRILEADASRSILFQCSQSSRGWWNSTICEAFSRAVTFQCSQSSRGWWNRNPPPPMRRHPEVSVLSVEPWLVELYPQMVDPSPGTAFQCSQSSRGWWNLIRAHRCMRYGMWFQCSQSSRGWWNSLPATHENRFH